MKTMIKETLFPKGPVKYIYVDSNSINANVRKGKNEPTIRVFIDGANREVDAHSVTIHGPSEVLFNHQKNPGGAHTTVKTSEALTVYYDDPQPTQP